MIGAAKTCSRCRIKQPILAFQPSRTRGTQAYCQKCQNEDNGERKRLRMLEMLDVKRRRGCDSCGFRRYPVALQWHHRDPASKAFQIANGHTRSRGAVSREVAKCDLLCANCHAQTEYLSGRASSSQKAIRFPENGEQCGLFS